MFYSCIIQGDLLYDIVNSDHQKTLKGSKEFQKENEWLFIVQHIKEVGQAFLSIYEDRTVCKALGMLYAKFDLFYQLLLANGGDQNNNSITEVSICQTLGIELIDGLGRKIQ